MQFARLTNTNFRNISRKNSKSFEKQYEQSPSIQNLIQKKYNLTSYRSFYMSDQSIKSKKQINQISSIRVTGNSPKKQEKVNHPIPLQFYPEGRNKKVDGFHKLQYYEEPSCPMLSIRKRYVQTNSKKKKNLTPKKAQSKITSNSLREQKKKDIPQIKQTKDQRIINYKEYTTEQKDKLITYYRQKYDNEKMNKLRSKMDYDKRKRISLLLQRAVQNKPQISYRSYEPLKTKNKFARPSAPVYEPKQEDFSMLDPW